MDYWEHASPAALTPWLQCIWERAGTSAPVRVLPDGCIDIVWARGAGTQVVGANTTAFLVPVAAGAHVVGARLHPGAAPALLHVVPEMLCDARLPVQEVLADDGARLATALESHADPAALLAGWLGARAVHAREPDRLVVAAVRSLGRSADEVGALAAALWVSERSLRRKVTAGVGYGPKRLGRVLRLGRALGFARSAPDLAGAAFEAGYADQAHFSGDCRELAGVPPSILLAE